MTRGPRTGRLDRAEPLANPTRACEGDVMRTLRSALAGMVIVALLVGAGMVVAEDDSDAVTPVTGTVECQETQQGQLVYRYDGVQRYRLHKETCQPETSDPRVNDPYEMVWAGDYYPDGRSTIWGTFQTIGDGPDGWRGQYVGWVEASGEGVVTGYAEGYGAYEGLTYVGGGVRAFSDTDTVDGLIYEGIPPELP